MRQESVTRKYTTRQVKSDGRRQLAVGRLHTRRPCFSLFGKALFALKEGNMLSYPKKVTFLMHRWKLWVKLEPNYTLSRYIKPQIKLHQTYFLSAKTKPLVVYWFDWTRQLKHYGEAQLSVICRKNMYRDNTTNSPTKQILLFFTTRPWQFPNSRAHNPQNIGGSWRLPIEPAVYLPETWIKCSGMTKMHTAWEHSQHFVISNLS